RAARGAGGRGPLGQGRSGGLSATKWLPSGVERTTLALQLDPAKARQYKHFLALAGVAQLARACACQAQGRRFDPDHPLSENKAVTGWTSARGPPVSPAVSPDGLAGRGGGLLLRVRGDAAECCLGLLLQAEGVAIEDAARAVAGDGHGLVRGNAGVDQHDGFAAGQGTLGRSPRLPRRSSTVRMVARRWSASPNR